MKKLFWVAVMVIALGLCACGQDTASSGSGTSNSGTIETINGGVVNPTKPAEVATTINIQQYARNESPAVLYTFDNMDKSVFSDGRMTLR